jgi:hypothetical protein
MDLPGTLFSLDQARRSGLSDAAIRHALGRGRIVRVRRGMYCVADFWQRGAAVPAVRHATQARAAWISLNRRGWASDYSAALLTGLPVPYGQPDRVTISQATRPEGRRAYRPGLRLRTAQVEPCDIGIEWGMAVLQPGRTAIDVARTRGFAAGLVLADAALAQGLTTASDLDRIAAFMRGWSGAAAARRVAEHASGLRESPIESTSFALFVDRCLPLPECNRWVVGEGRDGVRSDFVWLTYRVVGEADGRVKYIDPRDEPAETLVKEKARQLRIEELGFVVVRWTGAEVLYRPDVVIARIVRASKVATSLYGVPSLVPGSTVDRGDGTRTARGRTPPHHARSADGLPPA